MKEEIKKKKTKTAPGPALTIAFLVSPEKVVEQKASVEQDGREEQLTMSSFRLVTLKEMQETGISADICLRITPDGTVTVYAGKSEMGQGVFTGLAMIVAGELDADWAKMRCEVSFAGLEFKDPVWQSQTTGGSTSVRHMALPLRLAGAAARQMLVKAASNLWGAPEKECITEKGRVLHPGSGRQLGYGRLCGAASGLKIPKKLKLRDKNESKLGQWEKQKPLPPLDTAAKASGKAIFGTDVFVFSEEKNMLLAAVERSPAYGARPVSFNGGEALKVPGVRDVFPVSSGVAICADTIWALLEGRKALKIDWSPGTHPGLDQRSLEALFLERLDAKGVRTAVRGNAASALERAAKKIAATYFLPYLAHAPLEPMCCAARLQEKEKRCDIWTSTQNQSAVIEAASGVTGLGPERIFVHTTFLGGGFGRRLEADYAREAVEIAKKTGRPVKLFWTRTDDLRNDFYRPGSVSKIEGALDGEGRLTAWAHKIAVPSVLGYKSGTDPLAVEGVVDMDYEVPNLLVDFSRVDTPIPVGFWRSVGHSHNAFAVECFIDELAHAAGADPLEFRLGLLERHPRTANVLRVAAEKAGWGKKRKGKKGSGMGIAQHFSFGSYVAMVAEVSAGKGKETFAVQKIVCAVDCGQAVSRALIEAQITGGALFGLSAALKEEVVFAHGGVKAAGFRDYPILRMSESPEVEVHVMESGEASGGIGEVAVPPVAPAVANALFNATGRRVRRLPLRAISP